LFENLRTELNKQDISLKEYAAALGMYELGEDEQAVQSLATALYSVFGDQITFSS